MRERVFEILSNEALMVAGLSLAMALAVFWLLRGAPPGQSAEAEPDAQAPPAPQRSQWAAVGTFGILALVWGFYVALRFGVPWSLPLFALGFGGLIGTTRAARRHRHASPSMRRVAWACDATLTGSLLLGVLIVGNTLAFKYYGGRPIDFSADQTYSLESLTVNQLRDLDRPVRFIVFQGSGEQIRGQSERIQQLLRLYRAENPAMISIETLNPFTDQERSRELAERVPGLRLTLGGGIVVEYGEGEAIDRVVVRNSELFEADVSDPINPEEFTSTFLGEDALTTSLIRLRQGDRPRVAFTTGHGEPSIMEMESGGGGRGLGRLRARLEGVGMEVVEFNPVGQVPEATSVVIVPGVESPLPSAAVERLQAYLDRGGRLIVLLDNRQETGLEDWLKTWGVDVGEGLILDFRMAYQQPFFPYALIRSDSRHPIVTPLINRMVLVPYASPLVLLGEAEAPASHIATPMLRTGPDSWAETDPDLSRPTREARRDSPGPLVVGIAVTDRPASSGGQTTPRAVIFGSRYLADNSFATVEPTNHDLIVNALSWLQDRPDLAGIAPRTHVARVLTAEPNLLAKLVLLPTVLAVSLLIGLGLATYMTRRD
ncbi:Gldg family protein [soil metagenome]